jgi:hypothetical protein
MRKTWLAIPAAACLAAGLAVSAAAGTAGTAGTIYACVTSTRTLSRVQVSGPPSCPAGAYPVSWAATVPGPSPSPSPTATSPSPTPADTSTSPSPSPTGTAAGFSCVTSAAHGQCGPYPSYAQVTGNTSPPYVDNDLWGPVAGETQSISANSPGDWQVVNSTPAGHGGSVTSFPDTGAAYGEQPVSAFTSIVSSFTESMPHNSGTSAWAAYDLWFNNWADEVMIQHDFTSQFPCTFAAVQQFGGSNGVPVQTWGLCVFGSEKVWQLTAPGTLAGGQNDYSVTESSGSVDVRQMITWMEGHGLLPPASTITNLSYGFEICSTGGQPETFTVSSYGMTAA